MYNVCDGCLTAVYDHDPRYFTKLATENPAIARITQQHAAADIGRELSDCIIIANNGNCSSLQLKGAEPLDTFQQPNGEGNASEKSQPSLDGFRT